MMASQTEKKQVDSLHTLLENLHLVIEQLKGGENTRKPNPNFSLNMYWKTLDIAVKGVSNEATKLCMAFSTPPEPSEEVSSSSNFVITQEFHPLIKRIEQAVLNLVSAFYGLPKTQGLTLLSSTLDAVVNIVTSVRVLASVIQEKGHEGSQQQLQSTGGVWEHCDSIAKIPKDNKAAVLVITSNVSSLVSDALQEIEEAQQNGDDIEDFDEFGEENMSWTEQDKKLMSPAVGLIKASKATLKKTTSAIKSNGNCENQETISQLDGLVSRLNVLSPAVDDLAFSLYPPMAHGAVRQNADRLATSLMSILDDLSSTHLTSEADTSWIEFLNKAIDHNTEKIHGLVPSES